MLFARCQHHIRFGSGFHYAPLKAMLTKISKWSRIQDSFRITPKIESLVVFAIPDIPRKFQKDPSITFWVILLTHRQTNKVWQKHNLLGGGKNTYWWLLACIRKALWSVCTSQTLCRWIITVKKNHRPVAAHSWRHAVLAMQTMFVMVTVCRFPILRLVFHYTIIIISAL